MPSRCRAILAKLCVNEYCLTYSVESTLCDLHTGGEIARVRFQVALSITPVATLLFACCHETVISPVCAFADVSQPFSIARIASNVPPRANNLNRYENSLYVSHFIARRATSTIAFTPATRVSLALIPDNSNHQ